MANRGNILVACLFLVIPQVLACEDCICGSECFEPEDPSLTQAYEDVRLVIQGIRAGRILASPKVDSTIIHFDGTPTSFEGFLYQRQLAAIAALSLPVDETCNPTLVITYFHWGSLSWLPNFSTGCMDKCDTAFYINELIPYLPTPPMSTNPLSTSCLLAPLVAQLYPTCSINTELGSHQIAFMNDDIQTPPHPCFGSNARTAVKMADLSTPSPRFESSSANSIEAFSSAAREEASSKILQCMEEKCCSQSRSERSRFMESDGTLVIRQNGEDSVQEVDLSRNVNTRSQSLQKTIEGVIMMEELRFLQIENPDIFSETMLLWNQRAKDDSTFKEAFEFANEFDINSFF
ncbi:uncharacterized protein LOC131883594 [Tigriopus californicus]|uniref:uncharacterized protein LOC131883594 n=1 Tax=Tigriopus californicus TaxID=6832 RepID=UPI0027DA5E15|nr:uncharacterized protein LOC131883594 [Tigriopus californicus]|eukprot:TCALIF_01358-PA protein Name:"Protein of unknown function" AED:0.00 eAED:0.00 QI:170/1/1/1/1/1/3/145/347